MEYMAQLHFDILLIMFLAFSVLFSWWKGAYKSLRFFLAIILTFLALEVFSSTIFTYLSSSNHLHIIDGLSSWMSFLPVLYENRFTFMVFLIYIIVYIAVWSILALVMLPFRVKRENTFTYQPKKWKKFVSMILGLVNGVALTFIFLGGIHYIVPVHSNQIITSTVINHTGNFTSIQVMNQLRLEVEPAYLEFQEFEDHMKNHKYTKSYEYLLSIKETVYEIDLEFQNNLIPMFQNPLSSSLIMGDLPEDLYDVRGYTYALVYSGDRKTNYELILDQEYTNPQKESIEEHFDWLIDNQLFIRLIFQLGDDLEEMTPADLSNAISTLESTIYTNIHKNADEKKYQEVAQDIRYFVETKDYFRSLIDIDTNLSESAQRNAFNDALLNTTSLMQLATNYQSSYSTQLFYQEFQKELDLGDAFFGMLLKHISNFVPKDYLYLSSSIISKEYPALTKAVEKNNEKTWLNAFINDAFMKQSNQVSRLYYYQFLTNRWFSEYDMVQPITDSEFQSIMSKIDADTQTNHFFTAAAIKTAFDYFVFDIQGLVYLYETGVFTQSNLEILIQNDWTFISLEAQNHLQTILE